MPRTSAGRRPGSDPPDGEVVTAPRHPNSLPLKGGTVSARMGMDAGLVRQSAAAIASNAADLDRVIGSVNGLVTEIAANWSGEAATEFHHSWTHRHHSELTRLVAALHDYARQASRNADAQDRASAVSGVSSAVSGVSSVAAGGSVGDHGGWISWLTPIAAVGPGVLRLMEKAPPDVGRYPKSWKKLLNGVPKAWNTALKHAPEGLRRELANFPDDVLRYKRWGVVHDLNKMHGFIEGAGKVADVITVGSDVHTVAQDLRDHDMVSAGFHGATTAADVLKATKVGYLGGVAIQSWVQAGQAAQDVDWSRQGLSDVIHASPKDWASAFGESVMQMPGQLVKIF
jgi:WXG100 family type VII secretion target